MEEIEINPITISKPAILIQNAYKRYTPKNIVLNGLSLTVPDGSIYGLLGPSGCGKTTLLNCIIGRTELDAGNIELKVKRRSDVGYMPQSLCIHTQLTIEENFFMYGYLFGVSTEDIASRSKDLISFLELPNGNRLVTTLSGGQQRRVSLALTFIHNPEILILDEPTVGLDPILSQSIWERLLQLSSQGKSVIITTHYIEEAKQSHIIGVMRNGNILANEDPTKLMEKYNCNTLEDVFLLLSRKQEIEMKTTAEAQYPKKTKSVKPLFEENQTLFSITKFKGVTYKNVKLLKREYLFLILVLALPLTQNIFANLTLGKKPKNLPLGVLNEEIPINNCSYTTYNGCVLNENQTLTLSCLYLNYLRENFYTLIEYEDGDTALRDVNKKKIRGLLHFSKNYTQSLAERITMGLNANDANIATSSLDVSVDLKDFYIATCIKYDIYRCTQKFLQQIMENCGMNPEAALSVPLAFKEPVFGSSEGNFANQTAICILCLCCFFLPAMLTGGLLFIEKEEGILERLIVVGVSGSEILISLAMIQMLIHIVQTGESMFVTYILFDNPLKGMSWPLEGAHHILKAVNWAIPMTLPVEAAQAISSKSFSITHPLITTGFISCIAWSVIFGLIVTGNCLTGIAFDPL
ncbi:hypothetical protein PGB90_004801 [Kerria lacca]